MDENDLISQFCDYLRFELNRSQLTISAYKADLLEFATFITGDKIESFSPVDVTLSDVRSWLGHLGRQTSPRTVRRKTQSLRAFFRFLMKRRVITANPATEIVLAKTDKPLPEFVKAEEIEELLLDMWADESPAGQRDALVISILYSTGIRRAELLGLRLQDIDTVVGTMKVTGKRDKQRIVPIAPRLCREIDDYAGGGRLMYSPSHDYLFDAKGRPMSKSLLYNIVRNALSRTSAARKSPHVMRHTFATLMLNGGAGLESVKEFLGHESLATTQIYTHVSFAEMQKTYRQAHPRAEKKKKR